MPQNAMVDAMNEPVAPVGPIGVRSDVERVPSAADKARAAVRELFELEFSAERANRMIEVRRVVAAWASVEALVCAA